MQRPIFLAEFCGGIPGRLIGWLQTAVAMIFKASFRGFGTQKVVL